MSEEKFVELVERVFERIEDRLKPPPKTVGQHIREWAPIVILAVSMAASFGRFEYQQEAQDLAIAELKEKKADKDTLKVSLDAQSDKLTMIYSELVEIRKLSYPPSFTAFAPGTKMKVRKY